MAASADPAPADPSGIPVPSVLPSHALFVMPCANTSAPPPRRYDSIQEGYPGTLATASGEDRGQRDELQASGDCEHGRIAPEEIACDAVERGPER